MQHTSSGKMPKKPDLPQKPNECYTPPKDLYANYPTIIVLETCRTEPGLLDLITQVEPPAYYVPRNATEAGELLFSISWGGRLNPNTAVQRSWNPTLREDINNFNAEEIVAGSRRIWSRLPDGTLVMVRMTQMPVAHSVRMDFGSK